MRESKALSFHIGSLAIPYTVSESKRAKYIKLVMGIEGLNVVKPYRVSLEEVDEVLNRKRNWIYKHYHEFLSMRVDAVKRNWETGESVLFRGENYNIKIFTHKEKTPRIHFNGKSFDVFIDGTIDEESRKSIIERAFKKWFIRIAGEVYKERVDYYAKIIGLSYKDIKIKEQKTRWGSCSGKKNLNFNWKVILSPMWVLDYVVVHELCHLRYMNHAKEYWAMVERYMPDFKKAQEWLKKNGMGLKL
jgi:predicted metal-dependent hydrolase